MPFVCMFMIMATSLFSSGMSTSMAAIRSTYKYISATATSNILTVRSVIAVIAVFFSESYFKRFNIRKGTSLAMLIGFVGMLFLAFGNGNIVLYYIGGAIGGITYAYGLMLPASMLLKRWFNEHRGIALSIASAGTGLCSVIGAPLIQSIVQKSGLKMAFFMQCVVLLFVAALLYFVAIDDPSEIGLEPLGGKDFVVEKKSSSKKFKSTGLTKQGLLFLLIAAFFIGIGAAPASSHQTLNFVTNGYDAMTVAKAISLYGLTLIISKIIYGSVLDRFGAVSTIWIYGSIMLIGRILLGLGGCMFLNNTLMFSALIINGAGVPIETLGYPNWCADLSSKEEYPKQIKHLQFGYQLGGLLGAPLPGIVCDATGYYGSFYFFAGILSTAAFALALITYKKAEKQA